MASTTTIVDDLGVEDVFYLGGIVVSGSSYPPNFISSSIVRGGLLAQYHPNTHSIRRSLQI